ncbi:MAG: BatD family protein [Phycisphaerales bacterium]|nr:BatD family protein [Phycisphaerales bacterium]
MLVAVLYMLWGAPAVFADKDPSVAWQVETRTLQVGEPLDVLLVLTNTDEPEAPPQPEVEGGALAFVGGPRRSDFTQIVNGRRSHERTLTYVYRVVGQKPGTLTLPQVQVAAGRKTVSAEPIQLTITELPPQAENPAENLVFIEIEADRTRAYLGQTVSATLRIGIRKLERGGAPLDDRDTLVEYVTSHGKFDLSVFAGTSARRTERTLTDAQGERHEYIVLVLEKSIRAEETGTLTLGPVTAFVDYPLNARLVRGFFARPELEASQTRRVSARAEAVTVEIKSPPLEGQPAGYGGAIGAYTMDVTVRPAEVELNQPLTLSVVIRGAPIEGVQGPELGAHPELSSRFEFRQTGQAGELTGDGKVFRQAIFPRQEGRQTIPPIRWSYFDVDKESYVTLESAPIEINVLPATGAPLELLPAKSDELMLKSGEPALKALTEGLAANVTDPGLLLANSSLQLGWATAGGFALPPLVAMVVVTVQRRRRRLIDNRALARRSRARRIAEEKLRRLAGDSPPAARAALAADALIGFVADCFDLPAGAMTAAEVALALETRGGSEALVGGVREFLGACDAASYAGSGTAAVAVDAQASDSMRAWMREIESLAP